MHKNANSALALTLAGIPLRNPVILAAGTAGYVDEMSDALDLSQIGAVVTKSITAAPREGNPAWRIVETPRGMLNAIGLANVGADEFERRIAPKLAKAPTTVFGSIAGFSIEEYVAVARVFDRIGAIPAIELNVSCPNVHGGAMFGDTAAALSELVKNVRETVKRARLFVKLPPATTSAPGASITDLARAALDAGADALTIANTIPAMAIDVRTRRPRLANVTGGLSGPGAHPVIVRLVHAVYTQVAKAAGAPIIAAGGVTTWEDAAEFILAGASAVQMGSALFIDPKSPGAVVRGLERWVSAQGAKNISELTGAMETAR